MSSSVKQSVSVVLVEPQGSWNVGSVARCMMNGGLTDLRLVNPVPFKTDMAKQMACNAIELLNQAKEFATLDAAVADSQMVIGFTRRGGKDRREPVYFDDLLREAKRYERVALVFGRETDGMTNDELNRCTAVGYIPTSDLYPSLNLAQSVAIVSQRLFEINERHTLVSPEPEWITKGEMGDLHMRLAAMLAELGYEREQEGRLKETILHNLDMVFSRSGLREKEYRMLQGLISRVMEKVRG